MSMNNKPHVEEKDDCDHFLQSLAPQLRSFSPLARYKCQAEIQMLILRHLEQSQTSTSSFSHAGGHYQQPLNQHYNYNNAAFDQYQTYSPGLDLVVLSTFFVQALRNIHSFWI
ncbi:hypothetical protein RRG08_058118 [Elysia crispata]|uniref:BESS domain-containing protein n=1 Tax=Elysia crispata TaxID=231223 RepID=A0AAE0Y2P4_9GAST|nr:hypothetical protein RRG08_058118 [Elysia crispata]